MFRSTLKRNRQDFRKASASELDSTKITQSTPAPGQNKFTKKLYPKKKVSFPRPYQQTKVIPSEKQFSIGQVPEYILDCSFTYSNSNQSNSSSILIEDMQVPESVALMLKDKEAAAKARIGTKKDLCWIYVNNELTIWAINSEKPSIKIRGPDLITCVAFGRLPGTVNNSIDLEVFAIATPNNIKIYGFAWNKMEDLGINFSTKNQTVTWMQFRQAGLFFGSGGTLKLIKNLQSQKKCKLTHSETFFERMSLFKANLMERQVLQVVFAFVDTVAYCLVERKYNSNLFCKIFLWENGINREKEIQLYDLSKGVKLITKVPESTIIKAIRKNHPALQKLSIDELQIKGIFVTKENNSLGVCLQGGIFVEINNLCTVQIKKSKSCYFQNPSVPYLMFEPLSCNVLHSILKNPNQILNSPRHQIVVSLGLDNLSIVNAPSHFAVVGTDQTIDSFHLRPPEFFSQSPNPFDRTAQIENQLTGCMDNYLKNTILQPSRQWLSLQGDKIKLIRQLNLLDKTLMILQVHKQIMVGYKNNQNLKKIETNLLNFLKSFAKIHGTINIAVCLFIISTSKSCIQFKVAGELYSKTYRTALEYNSADKLFHGQFHRPVLIKNTNQLKAYALQMFEKLPAIDQNWTSFCEIWWNVYLTYFQSIFAIIKNKKHSFLKEKNEFVSFIRGKLTDFRISLIRKFPEHEVIYNSFNRLENQTEQAKQEMLSDDMYLLDLQYLIQYSRREIPIIPPFENLCNLIKHLIATIEKVNLIIDLFQMTSPKLNSNLTIYEALTSKIAAKQLRKMILCQIKTEDLASKEQIFRIIPEILNQNEYNFISWANNEEIKPFERYSPPIYFDKERLERIKKSYFRSIQKYAYLNFLMDSLAYLDIKLLKLHYLKQHRKEYFSSIIERSLLQKEESEMNQQALIIIAAIKDLLNEIINRIKSSDQLVKEWDEFDQTVVHIQKGREDYDWKQPFRGEEICAKWFKQLIIMVRNLDEDRKKSK